MESRYDQLSPVPPLTRVLKVLIITCVVMYLLDTVLEALQYRPGGYSLQSVLGLVPMRIQLNHWFWQFGTYIFLHGGPLHLLLNMLILWYFGAEMEQRMGEMGFVRYFFLCGIGAGLFNFFLNSMFGNPATNANPMIGASGAIYGLLAAYGIFFANRYFLVFFMFPMKAKYFVLVIAGIELMTGLEMRTGDNVAHFAHLGGMIVGGLYIYFRYVIPRGGKGSGKKDQERERLKRQFTLIVNQGGSTETKKEPEDKGPYWN